MSAPDAGVEPPILSSFTLFSSPAGQTFVRRCLRTLLPFDPHDYQLQGVCKALDGIDVIAITATGDGKTGYFYMFILMVIYLSNNPDLCPAGRAYPSDPALIVICPTNGIEEQMAEKMKNFGLETLPINAITVHNARRRDEDLWAKARTGVSMLMMSPEQLIGKPAADLLDDSVFWRRVVGLGIDEIHLLSWWGKSFRKAFTQIGLMRARLPSHAVVIGTSATVAVGKPYQEICKFLQLQEGQFHCIRRSNFRPGLQLLLRNLETGINGRRFPALLWILTSNRKTVIYCATIALAFRVTRYLWISATDKSNLSTRIRMYTALNWPSYNEDTRKILYEDPSANVTIATAAMAEGINAPDIQDVVIVGEVADPDEAHQRWGRAGRDWKRVKDARGIMYLTGSARKKAEEILKGSAKSSSEEDEDHQKKSKSKKKGPEMSLGMAQMICAPCLTAEQDRYYGNPPENSACSCEMCSSSPPPTRSPTCNCSRCVPEMLQPVPKPSPTTPASLAGKPIRADLKEEARSRLLALRAVIWREASERDHGSIPMVAFLPDSVIASIVNTFSILTSPDSLDTLIASKRYLQPHATHLWLVVCDIRSLEHASGPAQPPRNAPESDSDILNTVNSDPMEIDSVEIARVRADEAGSAGPPPIALANDQGHGGSATQPTPLDPTVQGRSNQARASVIPEHMMISWQLNASTTILQDSEAMESAIAVPKRRASKRTAQPRSSKRTRVEEKENR